MTISLCSTPQSLSIRLSLTYDVLRNSERMLIPCPRGRILTTCPDHGADPVKRILFAAGCDEKRSDLLNRHRGIETPQPVKDGGCLSRVCPEKRTGQEDQHIISGSGIINPETFDNCISKAGDMLSAALSNWQDDYLVKSVAEPFEITIPGVDKPLIGEFDMVVEEGGHDICIMDWKTSSSRWPVGKADYEQQAGAYCYAYRKKLAKNPLFRYDVITKAKEPQVGSWYTVRTEDELNRFAQLCRQVERCVNAEAFYRNESQQNCSECPYRNHCRHECWRSVLGCCR